MARRKKIIAGNWKMNPDSLKKAESILADLKKMTRRLEKVETIIFPPTIYLNNLKKSGFPIGAQDVSAETKGSHTGEISALMLANNGVKHVIIGHSERRKMGETDDTVNKKIDAALNEGLKVVVCIGEHARDEHGEFLTFLKNQLKNSFKRISRNHLKNITIAYEPLFAVGQKDFEAMSPHDVHQTVIFIRKNLIDHFATPEAAKVPVLYGGSVNVDNAKDIVGKGEADGLLVGRESLKPEQFSQILKLINKA